MDQDIVSLPYGHKFQKNLNPLGTLLVSFSLQSQVKFATDDYLNQQECTAILLSTMLMPIPLSCEILEQLKYRRVGHLCMYIKAQHLFTLSEAPNRRQSRQWCLTVTTQKRVQ